MLKKSVRNLSRKGTEEDYLLISLNLVCLAFFARNEVLPISFQQKFE